MINDKRGEFVLFLIFLISLLKLSAFILGSQIVMLLFLRFLVYFNFLNQVLCSGFFFILKFLSYCCLGFYWVSFKLKGDVPFRHIAFDYSLAGWDGLRNYLRDVPWEMFHRKVSLILVLLLWHLIFLSEYRVEWMFMSLVVGIRSCLIHIHDFYLFLLLPKLTEITSFISSRG